MALRRQDAPYLVVRTTKEEAIKAQGAAHQGGMCGGVSERVDLPSYPRCEVKGLLEEPAQPWQLQPRLQSHLLGIQKGSHQQIDWDIPASGSSCEPL